MNLRKFKTLNKKIVKQNVVGADQSWEALAKVSCSCVQNNELVRVP